MKPVDARPRRSFAGYYFGTVTNPRRAFAELMGDPKRLRYGAAALLLNALLYTMVYVFLTIGKGAPSSFTPWLAIPRDDYYFFNRFMLAPSMVAAWILSAGVAQLLSAPLGGKGRFEDMAAALGFAIAIACLASLAHDLPDSFLGAVGLLDLRAYEVALNSPTIWRAILLTLYFGSVLWFLVLYAVAARVVQGLSWPRAILVGFPSYAVYQLLFVVFNR